MNKDALEVLYSRRSIRKFKSEQIKDEELDQVLKAGMYAPSAMGMQSPTIIAVQNKDDIAKLNKLSLDIMNSGGSGIKREGLPYYGAPTIILVGYTSIAKNDYLGTLDCAAACTNMLNAAYALGLGSCWIHRFHEISESNEGKALLEKWGIKDKVVGVASIALGYPDMELPKPRDRKDNYIVKIK